MVAFDILLLGLRDPSATGRARFLNAMERLSGRPAVDHEGSLATPGSTLFRALDRDQAQVVVKVLDEAGVRIEIRPTAERPVTDPEERLHTVTCPRCEFVQSVEAAECHRCGLVFAKWEREKVHRMQNERRLEAALQKALQVRQEWVQRAKHYLEAHPLPTEALAPFTDTLYADEIPFLRLNSEEGPVVLTSRRFLFSRGGRIGSLPFEMVSDVDFGGGLVVKKDRTRLVLTLHGPIAFGEEPVKSLNWQLDKDASFSRDVVMDWCFARRFLCGSCGAAELDYRTEKGKPRARCMRCATDHEIDLGEAVAIPLIQE